MLRRFFCALLALTLCILFAARRGARAFMTLSACTWWLRAIRTGNRRVKLAVRDACLEKAREVAAGCADADEAYAALNANLAAFQSAATIAAREMGFDGAVTVETGMFAFPDRVYGALFVPAGDYRALRVTLGGGRRPQLVVRALSPRYAWWTRRRILPGRMCPSSSIPAWGAFSANCLEVRHEGGQTHFSSSPGAFGGHACRAGGGGAGGRLLGRKRAQGTAAPHPVRLSGRRSRRKIRRKDPRRGHPLSAPQRPDGGWPRGAGHGRRRWG